MSPQSSSQFNALLRLDEVDSSGRATLPIEVVSARLMALSLKSKGMWFGFVIKDAETAVISPGSSVFAKIVFLDGPGAREAFRPSSSVLFGDGVDSRGTLVLSGTLQA